MATATVGNILLDKEILLESGTNELEVLVFDVADYCFGINVAKVREVLPTGEITALPKAHSSVRGVFRLREHVIPCVSLMDHLGIAAEREDHESKLILTDFNQQQTAFLVDEVERIHRLSWEQVLAMPPLVALAQTPVTAVVRCDNRLVVMLDFEMIIDQVTERAFRTSAVENPLGLARDQFRIVLCDDSPTVRQAVGDTLRASGYTQLSIFENGAQAWHWIEKQLQQTGSADGVADLLISDVEMPQIDGLHLTKRIKDHPQLRRLPVMLYSSIVTPDNHKKGEAVGADMQVSKPELYRVVELVDQLISAAQAGDGPNVAPSASVNEIPRPASASAPRQTTPATAPTPAPRETTPTTASTSAQNKAAVSSNPPIAVRDDASANVAANANRPSISASKHSDPQSGAQRSSAASSPAVRQTQTAVEPMPVATPANVDPRLWHTFRSELVDRLSNLQQMLDRARSGHFDEDSQREVFRTLHTIKSASMVVPVDPVTRTTHLVESLLTSIPASAWPHDALAAYVQWLDAVANPLADIRHTLASSAEVEAELALHLAAAG